VVRRTQPGTAAVNYVHVVFTIPRQLSWLALQNKKVIYDLLFRASAATLQEMLPIRSISAHRSAS
jgi:hypothetical protein